MKKPTLAQNGTTMHEMKDNPFIQDFLWSEHLRTVSAIDQKQRNELIYGTKPKRPRGKKVFSTDKGVKR